MPTRGQRGPDRRPRLSAARLQAAQAAAEGITPLQLMLEVMRRRYAVEDFDGALAAATMAAPYCHARLSTQQSQQLGADGTPINPAPQSYVFKMIRHCAED